MRESKVFTEFRSFSAFQKNVEINKRMKIDFDVIHSNYTSSIFYPKTGYRHKFITSHLHYFVFIIHNKMKSDILQAARPEFWRGDFEKNIQLFDATDDPEAEKLPLMINFDLKNAYPNALFKGGFISADVNDFIQKRKKIERLQAIGIFASRKSIFNYVSGELRSVEDKQSELRNVYFYAAKVTDNIMRAAQRESGEDFIFYWFDGIYIRPNKKTEKRLTDFFESSKIEYKKEVIMELNIDTHFDKTFISYKDQKGDNKVFNIPHGGHHAKKTASEILTFLK